MKTFLEFVAEDIIRKYGTDLSRTAVVFPNKRAALFLNEYLARMAGRPIWSPAYITISDLFRQHSALTVGDSIKLICDLHKSFTAITGIEETLDHFYGWGQLLIADFDDIDKNMASAEHVFANLRDIHELDDLSYLTPAQKEVLMRFFSNFNSDHNTELRQRFIRLWSHFGDIYRHFRSRLSAQGIAYEGMLYRDVAENEDISFRYDRYLFVGFNLVQKVEQRVFQRLMDEGKAHFYWDFDRYFMAEQNEAGHYIRQYLQRFPNELDSHDDAIYNHLNRQKDISFISAATEDIQARYISEWLLQNGRIEAGRRTAIVMCDESLLPTVIHCLPQPSGAETPSSPLKVNITTGYPLQGTPAASFIMQLLNARLFPGKRNIRRLRSHPYAPYIEGIDWKNLPLTALIKAVAQQQTDADDLTNEALFRAYLLLNRIEELVAAGDLAVDAVTMQRLVQQLISNASIPFHGEPAVGLQLMGVLETRNLDFDHLLILSCNEGNMPKGINDASFIPYSIRKSYGLTTIDNKVAVFSYYFHSMIQRAGDVTILYNNSTEDGHTGEMSRFMLQLMVESSHAISHLSLQAGNTPTLTSPHPIQKTPAVMQRLRDFRDRHGLYPTSINRYLSCQLKFYYNDLMEIREPDANLDEEIDSRIFGNIFHQASQLLYEGFTTVMPGDIEDLLHRHPERIARCVDRAILDQLFDGSDTMPQLNGMQLINREVIIKYLQRLLQIDLRLAPFTILGAETKVSGTLPIATSEGHFDIRLQGIIDRLDRVTDRLSGTERIRVVDYKTGGQMPKHRVKEVADLFRQPLDADMHPDYFLQTMLYSLMVHSRQQEDIAVSPALLFIQHTAGNDYDPTIVIGKEKVTDISRYAGELVPMVSQTLAEMFEPTADFVPTADRSACQSCPYRQLCGL